MAINSQIRRVAALSTLYSWHQIIPIPFPDAVVNKVDRYILCSQFQDVENIVAANAIAVGYAAITVVPRMNGKIIVRNLYPG